MYNFSYHKPASVADAAALLAKADDGKLMAGGMTLLPTLKQRLAQPSDVIDLGALADLRGIRREETVSAPSALPTWLTTSPPPAASSARSDSTTAATDRARMVSSGEARFTR